METMTPISVIYLAPESMEQVEQFKDLVKLELEEGTIDPLEVYMMCKAMSRAMEETMSILQDKATEEAQKYGKDFDKKSFRIKVGEVGTKYIFDNCNDVILNQRQLDLKKAKDKADERMKFLKTLKEPIRIVDEESGESFVVNPPVKTSRTSVIVELK